MKKLFSLLALGLFLSLGTAQASSLTSAQAEESKCIEQDAVLKPTETWAPLDIKMAPKGDVVIMLVKLHNPAVADAKHVDAEIFLMAPASDPEKLIALVVTYHNEKGDVTFQRNIIEKEVMVKGKKKTVKTLDKCFTRVEGKSPLSPDKAQKSK